MFALLADIQVHDIISSLFLLVQVKERRAQLEKLRVTFARRASEYLRNYFDTMVDFLINEKSFFSEVCF